MGGALGNFLFTGGEVISTAASLLGQYDQEKDYYRSLAKVADEQAKQAEENAKRNSHSIFQEAGYQSRELNRNYSQLLGQQKTALAASGLGARSATAQKILKNSRLNALMDQEMLAENMSRSIEETHTQAALQAMQYRTEAAQYRTAAKRLRSGWWGKVNHVLSGWLKK
ncbi:MAG: hypothetical protein IJ311_04465 [Elusimicrobiaceae bacterium]|nr:hypothetical protein [Elusimicrobiaceae bacterium]